MNTDSNALPHSLEGLLTHADWVRALARRLVRDDAEADDVAQEVWREALERPPRHDANQRGWLAAVARNAARAMKRGDRRRGDRERATARPESLPSTTQLVLEASLSRELAGIALQLEEPYRTTMLLRWFREMDVDAIAEAQKLPRETVRTRLRRGLEMMREKLDSERGGRAAWLSAFAPLTRVDLVPGAAAAGAIGATWIWLSLAAAVLVTTGITWRLIAIQDISAVVDYGNGDYRAVHGLSESDFDEPGPTIDSSGGKRSAVAVASARTPESGQMHQTIEARVVDPALLPIAGFVVEYRLKREPYWEGDTLHSTSMTITIPPGLRERLRLDPDGGGGDVPDWDADPGLRETLTQGVAPRPRATSDANGLIQLSLPKGEWDRHFADEQQALVGIVRPPDGPETWVVSPCVRVGGIVVDETDRPLSNVHVHLSTRWNPDGLGEKTAVEKFGSGTEVDERGAFSIESVPLGVQSALRVWCDGYEGWSGDAPDHDDRALKIVLKRSRTVEPHVRGVVLDAGGRPFAGASVELGQYATRSDAQGRFDLKVTCCVEGRPLTASKRGLQPAIMADFGRPKMTDVDDVVLRLGGKPLVITGRVLDPDGSPIAGCFIRLVEATQSGSTDLTLEALSSESDEVRPQSAPDGAFEIGGLLDREYTLIAWHEERGFIARRERVAAGTSGVELKRDPSAFVARLAGSLVEAGGAPVGGARVSLCLPKFSAPNHTSYLTYGAVITGDDGSFVLENVPAREVGIWIQGEGLETDSVPMPAISARGIRLVAKLEVRIQLNVADGSVASIEFRDRDDRPCNVRIQLPDLNSQQRSVARVNGTFPPFDLGEAAVEAILLRADGTVVRRAPIAIRRAQKLALDL